METFKIEADACAFSGFWRIKLTSFILFSMGTTTGVHRSKQIWLLFQLGKMGNNSD